MKVNKFSKEQLILFFMCWAAYTFTYVCRLNYSAIMPEILKNTSYTNLDLASLGSAFFITYGISQIFTGALGDRMSSRYMVFIGLAGSAIMNIVLGFSVASLPAMITIWAINGFLQSMIWSPILKIGGEYFEASKREKFGLFMSTTVPIGTLLAYGVTILFLQFLPWEYAFVGCGLITLIMAIVWLIYTNLKLPKMAKVEESFTNNKEEIKTLLPSKRVWVICISTILVCLIPIAIHGALKDGITQFGPTYLSENFGLLTSYSIAITMVLPIINLTGAFIAKWLNKYIKNEFLTSAVFFGFSLCSLICLNFFADVNIVLTMILLAIVTNSMFAINVMMISFIPLKFAKYGKTSTMSGILNAIAYLGCSFSMLSTGKILDSSNWQGVYIMWIILAVVAFVFCLSFVLIGKLSNRKLEMLEGNN